MSYGAGMMASTQNVNETDTDAPTSSASELNQQVISDETFEPEELETSLEGS